MDSSAEDLYELDSLVRRSGAGDRSALEALLERASQRLMAMARMMLRHYPHLRRWEQTDDIFQNAMLRLQRSMTAVQPDSVPAFLGLAATQIRRTLIDLARHHFGPLGQGANYQSDPSPKVDDSSQQNGPAATDPAGAPETLQEWAAFHEAVEQMPVEEREVFDLIWYGGMPQAETAALLNVSVPTIQRRWQRARTFLYDALQGDSPPVD